MISTRQIRKYNTLINQNFKKLKELIIKIQPNFGTLNIDSDYTCIIEGNNSMVNTQEYGTLSLYGDTGNQPNPELDIKYSKEDSILSIKVKKKNDCENDNPNIHNNYPLCKIIIPVMYDLDVKMSNNAKIAMKNFQNRKVNVMTETGDILTRSINSEDIYIKTNTGSLIADKTLQGNLNYLANNAKIEIDKLQGESAEVKADKLRTTVNSAYVNEFQIVAGEGNINMKNLHSSSKFHIKEGNININGLTGAMDASFGHVDAKISINSLSQDSLVSVDSGNLSIVLIEPAKYNLDITSNSVDFSEKIDQNLLTKKGNSMILNSPDSQYTFRINHEKGSTSVAIQDWMASVLGKK